MSFPMWATSPLPYAVVLPVLVVAGWHWLPVGVRYAGIALEVLLVASMTPLGATALARAVAMRGPPARSCPAPQPDTIVVLGAGFEYAPRSSDDYGALHEAGLQRVFTAVALWKTLPGTRLVIAGGAGWDIREAVPMANLAVKLGVPSKAIEIEDRSDNTWQNAGNVAALSPPLPRRIWLVTSAMHMPRAVDAFRAWGFEPCAWPSDLPEIRTHVWPGAFIPQESGVGKASVALHELVGGLEYKFLAWRHGRRAPVANRQTP
ncbi:MAG TPA: YdcF family protein [Rhodanobacteraceae bacterium]|nr:YdcF family protein [Rhodanobacteraceae bacterium]